MQFHCHQFKINTLAVQQISSFSSFWAHFFNSSHLYIYISSSWDLDSQFCVRGVIWPGSQVENITFYVPLWWVYRKQQQNIFTHLWIISRITAKKKLRGQLHKLQSTDCPRVSTQDTSNCLAFDNRKKQLSHRGVVQGQTWRLCGFMEYISVETFCDWFRSNYRASDSTSAVSKALVVFFILHRWL
jgi:hypothetical protein